MKEIDELFGIKKIIEKISLITKFIEIDLYMILEKVKLMLYVLFINIIYQIAKTNVFFA